MTTTSASSDNENGSVSSWNSTSDTDNHSPYMDRDSGDDSSEEVSTCDAPQIPAKSAKRPRLEISNLLALSNSSPVPEKKVCTK